jgi:hypothetical protein
MRAVRAVLISLAGLVVLAGLALLLLVFPTTRSAVLDLAARVAIRATGYHLVAGSITYAHGELTLDDPIVTDDRGETFFMARQVRASVEPAGILGRSDRFLGLHSLDLVAPDVRLIHRADGTWNFERLIPRKAPPGAAPPPPGPPLRMTLRVEHGTVNVLDPQAAVQMGRSLSLAGVNGWLRFDRGAQSSGRLAATLRTVRGSAPLQAQLWEDDRIAWARATVEAPQMPVAPVIDAFVPAPDFIMASGRADVHLTLFDLGYDPQQGPHWQVSALATVRGVSLRVNPLIQPIEKLSCNLFLANGLLSSNDLRAQTGGIPLAGRGVLRIVNGTQVAFAVRLQGRLEQAKTLFQAIHEQDLAGPFTALVRITGPLSDIHVAVGVHARGARFAQASLPDLTTGLFYQGGHMTLTAFDHPSGGGSLWAHADLDLASRDVTTHALVTASLPAAHLPFVANLAPGSVVHAFATGEGPFLHLQGDGFAMLRGPRGETLRFFAGVDPQFLTLGPLLVQAGGGEALAVFRRSQDPVHVTQLQVYASRLPLSVQGGRVALADVPVISYALPDMSGTLNGGAFVISGAGQTPLASINARISGASYEGLALGTAAMNAVAQHGVLRIAQLNLKGPAADLDARGTLSLGHNLNVRSGAIAGTAAAHLQRFMPVLAALHPAGATGGTFALVFAPREWIGGVRLESTDARLGGVELDGAQAFAGGTGDTATVLGTLGIAGSRVWAVGSLTRPAAGAASRAAIEAVVPSLDVAAIPAAAHAGARGNLTGFGSLAQGGGGLDLKVAAALSGVYRDLPYAGDLDLTYAGGTLRSRSSRLTFERNQVVVGGAIKNLGFARFSDPFAHATYALSLHVREGDLAALSRFTGPNAPVTGSYDANATLDGPARHPNVDAYLDTDLGTIRGVAFNELHGVLRVRPGSIRLQDASVQLGTSAFRLDAVSAGRTFQIAAFSPHVDMSDFNDFFGGADVFAGIGTFGIAIASSRNGLNAAGQATLDQAAFHDYPLGHIKTVFSSRRGGLHAVIDQDGPAGAIDASGTLRLPQTAGDPIDLRAARYRVRARFHDVQIDRVLAFAGRQAFGLTGLLDGSADLQGTPSRPVGRASLALHDGYLRGIPVNSFAADLTFTSDGIAVSQSSLMLPFLSAQASGRYEPADHAILAQAHVDVPRLERLADALRVPGALAGEGTADIAASGTLAAPHIVADLDARNATLGGMAFDEARLRAQYAPGEVSFGDSSFDLAGKRGVISVNGTLPIILHPLALGPKERPVNLTLQAQGVDLSALDPLTRRFASLTGRLDATASLTGTAGNPVGKGSARIVGATAQSPIETVALTDASANLTFQNDTITLDRLHGELGRGTIDAQGAAHIVPAVGLRTYAGLQFWARVVAREAQVNVPNWLTGTLNGTLSVTRSGQTPYVAGNIGLEDAVIPFAAIYQLAQGGVGAPPQPAQAPGVPPLKPGHTIVYGGSAWGQQTHVLTTIGHPTPAPTGLVLPPIDLNVAVNAGNNVRILGGSSVNLTTRGNLTIAGNLRAPKLSGQFQAVRGQVGYFDTTFRIVSGSVTFDPVSGILPTLDVVAVTNVNGVEITLTVTGRVDNLTTDLSSQPAMSRDEIIATLLHAPQLASLTGAGGASAQTTLVQTAQSYFNAQLARSLLYPVESALAQELNLESISLIFNQFGNLAVEVRTRFSQNISAVYQSSITAPVTTAYGVSYRLQDFLALDVLQSEQPGYGLTSTVFNLHYIFR